MRDVLLAFVCGAAIIAGVSSLYLPEPAARPAAPAAPAPARSVPMCPAVVAGTKTCNPACKVTEVCIDGTCCQPASGGHGTMMAGSIWTADSLR